MKHVSSHSHHQSHPSRSTALPRHQAAEQARWQREQEWWTAREAHHVSRIGCGAAALVVFMTLLLLGMFGYAVLMWLREVVGL